MRSPLGLAGLEVMVGALAGATVSTVNAYVAAAPWLPAASTSATLKTCAPSASDAEVKGLVQAANDPESMAQA